MALIAWFPLNGSLNNNGINQNITLTNSGATVDSSGKTGSCYAFTSSQYMTVNNLPYSKLTNCSICFWIYLGSNESWLPFTGQTTSYYILATSSNSGNFYHSQIGSNWTIYADGIVKANPNSAGAWHHYCITNCNLTTWTTFLVNNYGGSSDPHGWNFTGRMNDLRIYDHVLSKQEVHEISQALVLHYPLNDQYVEATTNIDPCRNDLKNNASTPTGMGRSDANAAFEIVDFDGTKCYKLTINKTGISSWYGCYLNANPLSYGANVGQTVTRSMMMYIPSGYTLPGHFTESIEGNSTNKVLHNYDYSHPNTWQKVWHTGTIADTSTNNYLHYFCAVSSGSVNIVCYFKDFQMEIKDHPTPYVNGSRTPTTVYDCSGLKRNGTISGTLTINTNTKRYDCSTQVLDTGRIVYPFPQLQEFTYSYWFKRNRVSYSNREMIGTGWYGISMELNPNNTLTFRHQLTSGTFDVVSNKTFDSTSVWYHIALTRNSSGVSSIYVNGVLDKTGTNTNLINYTSSTAELFTYSGSSYQFRGSISDYRIYATALSANDILDLYNSAGNIDKTGKSHFYMNTEDSASVTVSKPGILRGGGLLEYSSSRLKTLDDGSTWVLLLHHNNPASYLFTSSNCWNYNDGSNLYSALHLLKNTFWMNSNGEYEFLACEKQTSSSSEQQVRWKQTSNPALSSTLTGYALISGSSSKSQGLRNRGDKGCFHNGNDWWCCCGSYTAYEGGTPGFFNTVTTGYIDLYVRVYDMKAKSISANQTNFYKDGTVLSDEFVEI